MSKKTLFKKNMVLGIIVLLVSMNIIPTTLSIRETHVLTDEKLLSLTFNLDGNIFYVGGSGPNNYTRIQDAIDNASNWDTVFVFSGLYNETLTIDKSIILQGENQTSTIIDGVYEEFVIHIIKDYVSIKNFTIRNSGGYMDNAGIKLDSSSNSITECTIYRTKTGVYVNNKGNNEINNCTFHTNGEGIFLKSSYGDTIRDCSFLHNGIGLHLQGASGVEISNSYAHTNGIGFFFNDSSHVTISHCAVSDNNDNQGGIFLVMSSYINITNSNICHNGWGLNIINSSYIRITRCDLHWNTHYAAMLSKASESITISNCEIANNFRYAFHVEDSHSKVTNNNFYKNSIYGLLAKSSRVNVRYNWWGFITGPAFTGFGIADRLTRKPGRILCFPWRLQPLNNIGSDWETNDAFTKTEIVDIEHKYIDFPDNDTDGDGVPDWWEEKYGYDPLSWDDHANLDPDKDALNNIEECFTDQWGSNPFHKDLFLEFDWVQAPDPSLTNKPPNDQIELMKSAFEKHNITLHVDDGSLGGGEEIPYIAQFSYDDIRDLYWDYFLQNDLNNPRKGIFRYGLIGNYAPYPGFAVIGWDHLDSFVVCAQQLVESNPLINRGQLIVTGSMHETGHTLGLLVDDFTGIDNRATVYPYYKEFWLYRNYKSGMSYRYVWSIMDYSDGSHGKRDFDDWGNLDFTFFKNTHFEWPKEQSLR